MEKEKLLVDLFGNLNTKYSFYENILRYGTVIRGVVKS
jgi:hypothetical protein